MLEEKEVEKKKTYSNFIKKGDGEDDESQIKSDINTSVWKLLKQL